MALALISPLLVAMGLGASSIAAAVLAVRIAFFCQKYLGKRLW